MSHNLLAIFFLDAQQSLLFDKGKSWVVIVIMVIIWAGLAAFLFIQNSTIKKLEDRVEAMERSGGKAD